MQEKNKENNKEEVILLTFQPKQMLDRIAELEKSKQSLIFDNSVLSMLNTDLHIEVKKLQKRIPKSFRLLWQDLLLTLFGGNWEERD